jgi:hypothetical protein
MCSLRRIKQTNLFLEKRINSIKEHTGNEAYLHYSLYYFFYKY